MKSKSIIIIALLILSSVITAQVPQGFNYQAVARESSGNEIINTALQVQVAVLSAIDPDIVVWEEEHSVTTNDYGMMDLVIGDPDAARISGDVADFSLIDWSVSPLFLRTEIYYEGTWHDLGNSRLVSVPYSMMANMASGLVDNTLQTGGSTFSIIGGNVSNPDALFEVRRSDGEVMFGVYNEGVEINVPFGLEGKGPKGGFAIGGFDTRKKGVTEEYFRVTRDSSRIYVNQNASNKGPKGGFAIGGFDGRKAEPVQFLNLTHNNYLIGQEAGESITTGLHNAVFGYRAGRNLSTGDDNVFLGHLAGYNNNSRDNVMIGNSSGLMNTGYNNIFVGYEAGKYSNSTTNTTFIGNYAGYNMIGDDNIAIGDNAGRDMNIEPSTYECFGTVVLGIDAGRNFGGSDNTFLGYGAGSQWGGTSGSGNSNTFVGAGAGGGFSAHLGSRNVCIGYDAGNGKTGDDKLYIANNSTTTLIYGDFATEEVKINGNLSVTGTVTASNVKYKSDLKYKTNIHYIDGALSAVNKIEGVYYNWKADEFPDDNFSEERQIGFIAQDVEKYFPELVRTDNEGYKALDYSKMTAVLLQAVKEQQTLIDEQEAEAENMKSRIEYLESRLNEIESLLSGSPANK